MAATQFGTDLEVGVGQTMGSYIVTAIRKGDDDIHQEDVRDEDGVLKTRILMQTMDKIELDLVCISGADPETDFPRGSISGVAPISNYYIEAMSFERTEGAARVTVTAVNLGIT